MMIPSQMLRRFLSSLSPLPSTLRPKVPLTMLRRRGGNGISRCKDTSKIRSIDSTGMLCGSHVRGPNIAGNELRSIDRRKVLRFCMKGSGSSESGQPRCSSRQHLKRSEKEWPNRLPGGESGLSTLRSTRRSEPSTGTCKKNKAYPLKTAMAWHSCKSRSPRKDPIYLFNVASKTNAPFTRLRRTRNSRCVLNQGGKSEQRAWLRLRCGILDFRHVLGPVAPVSSAPIVVLNSVPARPTKVAGGGFGPVPNNVLHANHISNKPACHARFRTVLLYLGRLHGAV
jgi:hypothetical protein